MPKSIRQNNRKIKTMDSIRAPISYESNKSNIGTVELKKRGTDSLFSGLNIPVVLGILMILVIALSFFIFSQQSLRLDEAQTLWQTSRSPLGILNIVGQDVHVPFYHIVLHFWQVYLGNSVYMARVFSLIFFVLSIPWFYFLGKLAYGKREGIFAAILFSISPFMNWYGNEIRMYSLFTLLVTINHYLFLKIYKSGERVVPKKIWWFYAVSALFGIYTHYFFFLLLFSQFVFFVFNRKLFTRDVLKKFLYVAFGLGVSFTPWVIYVFSLGTVSNSSPVLTPPNSINIFNTFSQFLFGFQVNYVNTILISLWPLAVLLGFMALRKNKFISSETVYFFISLISPIIIAFIISVVLRPVYLSRYLILTLPPFYLILSWVASTYPKNIRVGFKALLVLSMIVSLFVQTVSATTPVKENYEQASDYLEQNATASDIIVVSAPFTIYPVEYYYKGGAAIVTLPIWDRLEFGPIPQFDIKKLPEDVESLKVGHDNIWLLLSYDQGYEESLRLYFDNNFERLKAINFSSGLNLYEYKIRYE